MITLFSGLPGNGKTLYALNWVKAKSEKENRPVYYHGIDILDKQALPWLELDNPEDWPSLPPGSIVVFDESWKIFPVRQAGSKVPKHVEELATHRHLGIDLVLITQDAKRQLDVFARSLIGQHQIVVRKHGFARASIFEFPKLTDLTPTTEKAAIRHEFAYPKASFNWYKSAEIHTHKRKIPMKFWIMLIAPVIVIGGIYFAWQKMADVRNAPSKIAKGSTLTSSSEPTTAGPVSTASYLKSRAPRIAGLAYTAPAYDDVSKPVDAPFPAACVASKSRCSCFSQQATSLDVPEPLCRQIVARGYFRDWEAKHDKLAENNRAAPMNPRPAGESAAGDVNHVATIPAPVHVGLSDGFHAADIPTDQPSPNPPRKQAPGSSVAVPAKG